MLLSASELAIARSVIYSSLFDYPLTSHELHRGLIESPQTVSGILATYASSGRLQAIVGYQDGFFFPAGRHELVGERRRRETASRAFLERHRRLLALICALPYARLVALSGSLAHLNLERDGDLDLFIVTRGRRVWSVTVAVVLLAKLMRCRRIVCANFVIADSHLAFDQQDLFTANQIVHLKPIVGASLMDELLTANPFVVRFYPNAQPAGTGSFPFQRIAGRNRLKTALEWLLTGPSWIVETACRYGYGRYLRWHAGSWRSPGQVKLTPHCLKLHTRSHRQSILERFDVAMADALQRGEAATAAAGQDRAADHSGR